MAFSCSHCAMLMSVPCSGEQETWCNSRYSLRVECLCPLACWLLMQPETQQCALQQQNLMDPDSIPHAPFCKSLGSWPAACSGLCLWVPSGSCWPTSQHVEVPAHSSSVLQHTTSSFQWSSVKTCCMWSLIFHPCISYKTSCMALMLNERLCGTWLHMDHAQANILHKWQVTLQIDLSQYFVSNTNAYKDIKVVLRAVCILPFGHSVGFFGLGKTVTQKFTLHKLLFSKSLNTCRLQNTQLKMHSLIYFLDKINFLLF